ncbi:carboxypeptidase regulatory-like domain-containing protein [Bacillus kwashiorkori]|uniref:carboxypeptidase regulatory-like domain-containing protein n=1 Tax=Bacillus kwashiorkori TaxID=1522318 RepID=UPI000780234A|nr:carboxypeptidase regulatory-like domain-containing protein [Bacillus kwashiorkori]
MHKKKTKKLLAYFFTLLILFSSFLPEIGHAQSAKNNLPDPQQQEISEKEREQQFKNKDNSSVADKTDPEAEFYNILTGLGYSPKILDGEQPQQKANNTEKIDKNIYKKLEKSKQVDVLIKLKNNENIASLYSMAKQAKKREDRIKLVQDRLKSKANASQKAIKQVLSAHEKNGKAKVKKSYWISNMILATVDIDTIEELKKRDDVETVTLDKVLTLPEVKVENSPPRLPEWGLEKIQATKVWGEYGIRGEGIVVGIMDTGVDGNHEALKHNYRGRDGNHQYSWIDLSGHGYQSPQDGNGHGTHVAGTAVGGGKGEPIGVAPEAEWIAAKIFSDGGSTTTSAIHAAFEWFMAPGGDPTKAPHVVNNSWGNSNTYNTEFYEPVQAWIAAGIFPLFAAGNDGPGSQTIGAPGSFIDSFAVGATDEYDQIAYFSSRGPVFWENENGELIRHIKPDISAPGHYIYSAWPTQLSKGKYNTISGTSMATPHVAGAIALLLSANPNLSINDIKNLLKNTARVEPFMGTVPNDLYGSGIINIYQAVTEAAFAGTLKGKVTNTSGQPIPATLEIPRQSLTFSIKDNGEFEWKIREGIHNVKISSFGYKTLETKITIKKDAITEVDWKLTDAEVYTINGNVKLQGDNKPVPYAFIRLKNTPLKAVRTDEHGNFELKQIPVGTYEMLVTGEGIQGKSIQLNVTENMTTTIDVSPSNINSNRDWKTANNNYQRNAVSYHAIDVEQLELQWEYHSPGRGEILFSTPAVANNQVILTTDRGWVVSLDAQTGKEQWSVRFGQSNRSTPTIENGTIYVSGGMDGNIYALDLETGRTKWVKNIGQPAIYESALYHNDILYVSSGLNDNAKVFALDAKNGTTIWSKPLGASSFSSSAIGDNYLYVGSYDNRTLRALNLETGEEIWKQQIPREGFASRIVYYEGDVYTFTSNFDNGSGSLYVFDGRNGSIKLHINDIGDPQMASPIIFEDIIIASSFAKPLVRAFDKNSGVELWSNKVVGQIYNTGSITANGILFLTGLRGHLYAIDVYTGEILTEFTLPSYSTSSIPVVSGSLYVPHLSGIQSYGSMGEIIGTIKDENGNPLEGKITIIETGKTTVADENGKFSMKHLPGTFTLKVSSYGKKQHMETINLVSGYKHNQDFILTNGQTGELTILVKDKRTNIPLENVAVALEDTPVSGSTDANGTFTYANVFEGTYNLQLKLNGYAETIESITIEHNQHNETVITLQPYDIAVLNDFESEITSLLNLNGYFAEERGWDVVNDLHRYQILYLNGAYTSDGWKPTESDVKNLINKAKEADVSIIFADAWGNSYGSIEHLVNYYNDPKEYSQRFGNQKVQLRVDVEHPIFTGFEKGQHLNLYQGDFAWFNNYSGRNIATISSDATGYVGTGVAYKAVSNNSAHVLLASHAASPWVSPLYDWLPDMQSIFINSIDYLLNPNFGTIKGTVMNSDGDSIEAVIEVVETGVTIPNGANFEFYHDSGDYTLNVRASGYKTKTIPITVDKNIPVEISVTLDNSEGSNLQGTITNIVTSQPVDGANISLQKEGETVSEVTASTTGHYELLNVDEGNYQLVVSKDGFVTNKSAVTIEFGVNTKDIELYPMPKVAVYGDYYSYNRSFKKLFADYGIPVIDLTAANVIEQIGQFDVVFFNEIGSTTLNKTKFNEMLAAADKAGTSLIFGDSTYTDSPIHQLALNRQDPKERIVVTRSGTPAGYIVEEEHPIFNDYEVNDFIELMLPSVSRVSYFNDYSGYSIASLAHRGSDPYGHGVAYKPRTGGSIELLMSGHGFTLGHHGDHYTVAGKEIMVNAVLWSAFVQFPEINGTVLDENGNPLEANIKVKGENFATVANDTGEFSIAIKEGDYELEVSAFGYETKTIPVRANMTSEPIMIEMDVDSTVGTISGVVENEQDGNAINNVAITVRDYPRSTESNNQGRFTIDKLMPGTYTLEFSVDNYVVKEVNVTVSANTNTDITVKLKPSPTIGLIVDYNSTGNSLTEYLQGRGYYVLDMFYTDLDKIAHVDLIIANSAYDNSKIPNKATFEAFVKELDKERKSIIWTGFTGGNGSIRFLHQYEKNPAVEITGSKQGVMGRALTDHPIFDGVELNVPFPVPAGFGNYYAFDGYDGITIGQLEHPDEGKIGSMIAYKGRTTDSVEILLATMTVNYHFNPGSSGNFDPVREKILNNAILWALNQKEKLTGEIHGQIKNNQGMAVQGTINVLETGKTIISDENGTFYIGLQEGSYTLQVEAFGHETKDFTININNGDVMEELFELQADDLGKLTGTVKNATSETPISGATIEVLGTPIKITADENGYYEIGVPIGEYDVRASAPGFTATIRENIRMEKDATITADFLLAEAEKIAVITSSYNESRVRSFIDSEGYIADYYTSSDLSNLINNMSQYSLIIYNNRVSQTAEQFRELVQKADEQQVSMIFSSQYSGGTIGELVKIFGDPEAVRYNFVPNHINIKKLGEHPIYAGIQGEEFKVLQKPRETDSQQYAIYEGYSGTTIGAISHDTRGVIGDGIGFSFRSANSVHLLLSGFEIGNYSIPNENWTPEAKALYRNAIDWAMNASLGEIRGTVTNEKGEPIENANVLIPALGMSTVTNVNGEYRFGAGTGQYEIKATAKGYHEQVQTIEITEQGQTVEVNFVLEEIEGTVITGVIKNKLNDAHVNGASVSLYSQEEETVLDTVQSDDNGNFTFTKLLPGNYKVIVNAEGFAAMEVTTTVGLEPVHLEITLSPIDIAVLGDYNDHLVTFLNQNGLNAQTVDWSILGNVHKYKLIVVNTNKGTKEQISRLIHETDRQKVSLVFLGTWGVGEGSIQLLEETIGYPELDNQGYNEGPVILKGNQDHPLFANFSEDVIVHSEGSPYSTFKNYPGVVIGEVEMNGVNKGASVAYEFRSDKSIHLLLSSFAVTNIIGPDYGWTEEGKAFFIQALQFAMNVEQEAPSVPVWDNARMMTEDNFVTISGTANAGDLVRIYELKGNKLIELGTAVANGEGKFSIDLEFSNGNHSLIAEAKNYRGKSKPSRPMQLIVKGKPTNKK